MCGVLTFQMYLIMITKSHMILESDNHTHTHTHTYARASCFSLPYPDHKAKQMHNGVNEAVFTLFFNFFSHS